MERQTHTEVVEAPIELCYDTIVDFEHYPAWFTAISTAKVLEHDRERGLWRVRYELNMIVKTVTYTLSYAGARPGKLDWKLVEGDVKNVEGSYVFTSLEPDVTEAACSQGVDVGFWIPGPLRRTFERTALVDSVREFKKAAEERARAAETR